MFWPLVQVVNFRYAPPHTRAAFVAGAGFFWCTILSYFKSVHILRECMMFILNVCQPVSWLLHSVFNTRFIFHRYSRLAQVQKRTFGAGLIPTDSVKTSKEPKAGLDLALFRSTLRQSLPNKAGLKCPSVRAYVLPSTERFFDFNDIWHVGRGRWVMHDGT